MRNKVESWGYGGSGKGNERTVLLAGFFGSAAERERKTGLDRDKITNRSVHALQSSTVRLYGKEFLPHIKTILNFYTMSKIDFSIYKLIISQHGYFLLNFCSRCARV